MPQFGSLLLCGEGLPTLFLRDHRAITATARPASTFMAKTTVAQSPATATRRAPKLVFRAANARRPFRRGDLALHAGSIVVICMSEHDNGDLDAELPVRTTRGVVGNARARS